MCFYGRARAETHMTFILDNVHLDNLLNCFPHSLCFKNTGVSDFTLDVNLWKVV